MKEADWVEIRRKFVASASVAASTVRGQNLGSILGIRATLGEIPVEELKIIHSDEEFREWLDSQTKFLMTELCGAWGSCRKLLNIFIFALSRDHIMREHLGLDRLESYFEVPLDGKVVAFLSKHSGSANLPPKYKFRIKTLTPEHSELLQETAMNLAAGWGIPRVWLDLPAWPS